MRISERNGKIIIIIDRKRYTIEAVIKRERDIGHGGEYYIDRVELELTKENI
jgi:hypothetical protein